MSPELPRGQCICMLEQPYEIFCGSGSRDGLIRLHRTHPSHHVAWARCSVPHGLVLALACVNLQLFKHNYGRVTSTETCEKDAVNQCIKCTQRMHVKK